MNRSRSQLIAELVPLRPHCDVPPHLTFDCFIYEASTSELRRCATLKTEHERIQFIRQRVAWEELSWWERRRIPFETIQLPPLVLPVPTSTTMTDDTPSTYLVSSNNLYLRNLNELESIYGRSLVASVRLTWKARATAIAGAGAGNNETHAEETFTSTGYEHLPTINQQNINQLLTPIPLPPTSAIHPSLFSRPDASHVDEAPASLAICIYSFTTSTRGQLSFKLGDFLLVRSKPYYGWLVCEELMSGERGIVPVNYIKLKPKLDLGLDALGLYDFIGCENDQISFHAGEFMQVLSESQAGWLLVQHADGRVGNVPVNFVKANSIATESAELNRRPSVATTIASAFSPTSITLPLVPNFNLPFLPHPSTYTLNRYSISPNVSNYVTDPTTLIRYTMFAQLQPAGLKCGRIKDRDVWGEFRFGYGVNQEDQWRCWQQPTEEARIQFMRQKVAWLNLPFWKQPFTSFESIKLPPLTASTTAVSSTPKSSNTSPSPPQVNSPSTPIPPSVSLPPSAMVVQMDVKRIIVQLVSLRSKGGLNTPPRFEFNCFIHEASIEELKECLALAPNEEKQIQFIRQKAAWFRLPGWQRPFIPFESIELPTPQTTNTTTPSTTSAIISPPFNPNSSSMTPVSFVPTNQPPITTTTVESKSADDDGDHDHHNDEDEYEILQQPLLFTSSSLNETHQASLKQRHSTHSSYQTKASHSGTN